MLTCEIIGRGAWGPGFNNWQQLVGILNNSTNLPTSQPSEPKPGIIPANERRRAPLAVRLAIETSWQACQEAGLAPEELACVFSSGIGDTNITDYLCKVLASDNMAVSPTKFHNSVHNAAAGYWTISTGCMAAANSVSGFHDSVSVNIVEAMSQCVSEQRPILLTAFDVPTCQLMEPLLLSTDSFAASLVLAPAKSSSKCTITAAIITGTADWTQLNTVSLDKIYQSNPSARFLQIAEALTDPVNNKNIISLPLSRGTKLKLEIKNET